MFHFRLTACLALFGLVSSVQSFATIDDISFGHKGRISSDGFDIHGWKVSGENHHPDILSDRIILTPPYPGNKRGALWAEKPVTQSSWAVDLEFRASGPERGYGSLQFWYIKDGESSVGRSSIYTAPQFDGFVLVVDQYGGKGGSIRGFLNDGAITFKGHHDVDSLAFGQCNYAYRNRGEFTHMHIRQMPDNFQVLVDGKICIESSKIQLPSGYYLGLSAASAENPDSFEVHSFITSTPESSDIKDQIRQSRRPDQQQQQQPLDSNTNAPPPTPQSDNSGTTSGISSEHYTELQNRLDKLDGQISSVLSEFARYRERQDQRHDEIMTRLRATVDGINSLDRVTGNINQNVLAVKREVDNRDYQKHLSSIQDAMQETKSAISAHLPQTIKTIVKGAVPSLGVFVFIVLGFQGLLALSYFWYKHRRNTMPKKFL